MLKRAEFVKNHGGEYVMVDIITCGWSGLQTLRERNEDLKLVLHAHRAGHAAFTRGRHGVSMIVIAELARLIGVDQIHIGTIIGKMVGDEKEVRHIGEEIEERFVKEDGSGHILSNKWYHIKPTFAVCSGGLYPGLVPMLIKTLGNDIIIQSGGGVHGNPLGTKSGAAAMRHAVDAALKKISLKDYAKDHKELRAALDKWGFKKMD
jgi:ribulose-bisphosphate carboxylase large chain